MHDFVKVEALLCVPVSYSHSYYVSLILSHSILMLYSRVII